MNDEPVAHLTQIEETEAGLVASGGWCAPSGTLYGLEDAGSMRSLLEGSKCPSKHPASEAAQCSLPDRLDRHGDGHQTDTGTTWPVTSLEQARWEHDCSIPLAVDPQVAWDLCVQAGAVPDELDAGCPTCGAQWRLYRPTCGDCGKYDGEPSWNRWPPIGGAWDGTFSVARGGITFSAGSSE